MPSKVKELADAEAERAEAAEGELRDDELQPDEPQPADDPAGGEPEPADDGDGESEEAFMRKLDAALRRFERDVAKLFDAEPPLQPAPYDGVLGYVVPGALAPRTHDSFRACPVCNGLGDVLTGSHKPNHQTQPCPRCAGRGYLNRLSQPAPQATPGYTVQQSPPPPAGMVPPPPAPAPAAPAANGDELAGYGVPSWAGDPTIQPKGV